MTGSLQETTAVELDVFVPGRPAAQGSKRHLGRGVLVEQSKAVGPWRQQVAWCARQARGPAELLDCALVLQLEFVMPRPASTPKLSTPPAVKRPDIDKLSRAICDALSVVIWRDDSLVVDLHARKRIAEIGEAPGCRIVLRRAV
ncbi:MAG TPA: RusA family crossover junction endodeoxyribonuclease [Pseudonocardiaceae bacterium]